VLDGGPCVGKVPSGARAGSRPSQIYSNYPSEKLLWREENRMSTQNFNDRGCTMTKDPVCGMKIDENTAKAQTQYHGQKYSFCSDECKQKFERNPEQYSKATAA
jgi:YHS domain-containing protein